MSLFSNIIRGGQLSLHALRMFKQVFNTLCIWSLSLSLLAFSWKVYKDVTLEELRAFSDQSLAKFLVDLGFKNKVLNITLRDGDVKLSAETVATEFYFISFVNRLEKKVISASIFALQFFIGLFVFFSLFFIIKGFRNSGIRFMRGARFEAFKDLKKKIKKHNRKEGYRGYSLCKLPYPAFGEMQHTLVIGANGVGKTILISDLVEEIRNRGDRAIIFDKKCDYTQWFYDESRDYILNPFDKRGEEWSLLGEISHSAQIKPLAEAFIPNETGQGRGDDIWNEAARIAFTAVIEKLFNENQDLSNKDIIESLLKKDMNELADFLKDTVARNIIDPSSPKTAASVLFVLSSRFNSLRLTEGKASSSFSIRKWMRGEGKEGSCLFLNSKAEYGSELSPLQTAFFEIAIGSLLSLENGSNQKTWIILDELASLQKIPSLAKGLSLGRSYGGCFVLGFQNISQIREIYGRNTSESLSSECHNRCVFKANDPDTAKWIVANLGEAEVMEFKEGHSYGAHNMRDGINVNTHDKIRSLLLPSEIQNLERLHLYIKMVDFPAVKTKLVYKKRRVESQGFLEKPLELKALTQELELPKEEPLTLFPTPKEQNHSHLLEIEAQESLAVEEKKSLKEESSLSLNTGKNVTTLLSSKFFKRRHDNA